MAYTLTLKESLHKHIVPAVSVYRVHFINLISRDNHATTIIRDSSETQNVRFGFRVATYPIESLDDTRNTVKKNVRRTPSTPYLQIPNTPV